MAKQQSKNQDLMKRCTALRSGTSTKVQSPSKVVALILILLLVTSQVVILVLLHSSKG